MNNEETSVEDLVGAINYSNRGFETFKLKPADDAFQFRPLPPLCETLKRRKDYGLYWKTHFGWKGIDENGKERVRPFLCIEEKRDGRIVQSCSACNLRKQYEDEKNALFTKKRSIEDFARKNNKSRVDTAKALKPTEDRLKEVGDWLYGHGLDGKFRLPCINRQGKIGLFLMPFGAMKKFRERCRELNTKYGIDPCGVKGVWFEATRNGKASRDSDDVQPVMMVNKEDGSSKLEMHILDRETVVAAKAALPDLGEMMEKQRITEAQIDALVNCSGDPEEVDRILNITKSAEPTGDGEPASSQNRVEDDDFGGAAAGADAAAAFDSKPAEEPQSKTGGLEGAVARATAKSKAEEEKTAQEQKSEAPAEDDEEAALERALAAAKAKKAAKAAAEKVIEAGAKAAAKPAETVKKEEPKAEPKKAEPKKETAPATSAADVSDGNFEDLFNT
jgi:hypothetical protein